MVGIESQICFFADDCVCYCHTDGIDYTSKLQKCIDQLGKYTRKLRMRFRLVKCNMQLTRKRIKKINAVYCSEGTVLENVDNIKYLSVTISKDLKCNTHVHVNNICTKTNN